MNSYNVSSHVTTMQVMNWCHGQHWGSSALELPPNLNCLPLHPVTFCLLLLCIQLYINGITQSIFFAFCLFLYNVVHEWFIKILCITPDNLFPLLCSILLCEYITINFSSFLVISVVSLWPLQEKLLVQNIYPLFFWLLLLASRSLAQPLDSTLSYSKFILF